MKLYIDANIYLDLFLNRKGKYVDFAAEAARIFYRAKSCEFEIVISGLVIDEIVRKRPSAVLNDLRLFLGPKAVDVAMASSDVAQARSFSVGGSDALHMAIAARSADCIVTRNIKDFVDASIPVFLPESF
jgi:predicted nucleic acid-binding protein